MLIRKPQDLPSSEITPKPVYIKRREFLQALPLAGRMVTTTDSPTPYRGVTTYNNFYEFGTDKSDPATYGNRFKPRPWSVTVAGECAKPGVYTLEDILKPHSLEERVYRMRCVEGWSMVIPWVGFPLRDLLARFEPNGDARFVEFTTVLRPDEMIGQRPRFPPVLRWPYREGLRMDEAMHPLDDHGGRRLRRTPCSPRTAHRIRLVVPWKYGFKSIKSIVQIDFVRRQPRSSWEENWPDAYGFYSNVNPTKDHPGHSQAQERRIGEFFYRRTLMFNGYGDQVASLYKGMDLRRFY